jgi:hypothetical protein
MNFSLDVLGSQNPVLENVKYSSPSWQLGYARRSALERINNLIGNGFF